MSVTNLAAGEMRRPATGPRAEYVLGVLALLSLALIPVHIRNVYEGLPAHPLFLHVPVILIPLAVVGALVLAFRPSLFSRFGVPLAGLAVVALVGTVLTVGAGEALRVELGLVGHGGPPGGAASLIARHASAALTLRRLMIAFALVTIACVLVHRVVQGQPTGRPALDRLCARLPVRLILRAAVVALSVLCGYFVFHTGDLGAKAVWAHRVGAGNRGFPPAGGGGAPLFPGGSGGPPSGP